MATVVWDNSSNNDWSVASHWSTNTVPGPNDDAVIHFGYVAISMNEGTIHSLVHDNSGALEIDYGQIGAGPFLTGHLDIATNFTNSYQFNYYNYSTSDIQMSIGGTLSNDGAISVGNTSQKGAITVSAGALNNTNQLYLYGKVGHQTLLNVGSVAGFGTLGHLSGAVDLETNAVIQFASGQITTIDAGSVGGLTGPGLTLNYAGAQVNVAGGSGPNSALRGLTTINGNLALYNGASATFDGPLTTIGSTGSIRLDDAALGGSSITDNGALVDNGVLSVGNGNLLTDAVLTTTALTDGAGSTLMIQGSTTKKGRVVVGSAAGLGTAGVLSGSTITINNNGILQFASGQITTLATGLNLLMDGAGAQINDLGGSGANSALRGLTTNNALVVTLGDGVSITIDGSFTTNGAMRIDNYSNNIGGTTIAVGGTFTNRSTFFVGNTTMTTADTITLGGFQNIAGTFTLQGGSTSGGGITTLQLNGNGFNSAIMTVGLDSKIVVAAGSTFTQSGLNALDVRGSITGAVRLAYGAIEVEQGASVPNISFTGSSTLIIDSLFASGVVVSGFGAGDTIELAYLSPNASNTVQLLAGNVLEVRNSSGTALADVQLNTAENFAGATFSPRRQWTDRHQRGARFDGRDYTGGFLVRVGRNHSIQRGFLGGRDGRDLERVQSRGDGPNRCCDHERHVERCIALHNHRQHWLRHRHARTRSHERRRDFRDIERRAL